MNTSAAVTLFACLAAASSATIVLVACRRHVKVLTLREVAIVVAVGIPWVANALAVIVFGAGSSSEIGLVPVSIVISGVLLLIGIIALGAPNTSSASTPVTHDAVIQGMRDAVVVVNGGGRILDANKAATALLAPSGEALEGRAIKTLCDGRGEWRTICRQLPSLSESRSFEMALPNGNDGPRWVDVLASTLGSAARPRGCILVMRDVTERRLMEEELLHRALHDHLTGLPNRAMLLERIADLLAQSRRSGGSVALLMLDLDHFKEINDTFGHHVGDQLLCVIGQRLRAELRSSDLVARLGGDEFAVMLPRCDAAAAMSAAAKLREAVTQPVVLLRHQVSVAASIGVAVGPRDGGSASTLMQRADVALYLAKERPEGIAQYEASLDPNSPARLVQLNKLRSAIAEGSLTMHYQPIVDGHGEVLRLEALARWPLGRGRTLAAAEFIPLAERNGLLPHLTRWALRTAVWQCREWGAEGWRLPIALNLSAADLADSALVTHATEAIAEAGIEPDDLWFEIKEAVIMKDPAQVMQVLTQLREAGIRVAIDDFGVGQSSLACVSTLPADELKIDKHCACEDHNVVGGTAITRATVALAHELGLTVTAAGVETQQSVEWLRVMGCDGLQGFHIAPPMPADEVSDWLKTQRRRSRLAPGILVRAAPQ